MIVAGCDVGSLTAKAVVMKEGRILAHAIILSGTDPAESATRVMEQALGRAGCSMGDVRFSVGTGYGKERIPFVGHTESEITCHAKGAWWNNPSVRTVVDIGGQDAKAIRVGPDGKVMRYIYNDKCASGTGRFLEVMAEAMDVPLSEMGQRGREATEKITISNQCVIFAETEVVSLLNEGREVCDIIGGLHHAMANRVASLAKSIGVEETVVMTGGVAKNCGVFDALASGLGVDLQALTKIDPQVNGALGAALLAGELAA